MKKLFITGALFLFAITAEAQITIYNGNSSLSSGRTVSLGSFSLHFRPLSGTGLYLTSTGFVGLGTQFPSEKLEVLGNMQSTMGIFTNSLPQQNFSSYTDRNYKCTVLSAGTLLNSAQRARTFQFMDFPQSNLDPTPTVFLDIEDRNYKSRMSFWARMNSESAFTLFDKAQTENFKVYENGNGNVTLTMAKPNSYVCIGTSSYMDGSDVYKLSVSGNIRAHRVKVYTTWADYVFEEDYQLPTLDEVEKHIKQKGHLKDIPSAKEVEENGIELGEMNKLLLQKIEELTLYTIELNKELNELKKQVNNK